MNRRQFFDKHAPAWDSYAPAGFVKMVEQKIVPMFNIPKGAKVLDVGCGTGIILPALKRAAGPSGAVVAMDYSGVMLKKAKEKYGEAFMYVRANALKTPFKRGEFDAVVCFSVFPHFINPLAALKELVRVLKPGKRLIVAHASSRDTINNHHRKVGTIVAKDYLPDADEMAALMKGAGLLNVRVCDAADHYLACGVKVLVK